MLKVIPIGRVADDRRASWLPNPGITTRKAPPLKSIRASWIDGQSLLDINFYPKGPDRTQVTVQHNKLPNAEQAEAMKNYWSEALESLGSYLTA